MGIVSASAHSRPLGWPLRRLGSNLDLPASLVISGGALLGLMTGALAARDPLLAAFAALAVAVALVVGLSARAVPAILVLTLFVEGVSLVPGLRVGRAGGVLAITLVLLYLLSRGRGTLRFNALLLAVLAFTVRYLLLTFVRARANSNQTLERVAVALLVALGGYTVSGLFLSLELGKPLWIVAGLALALDAITRPAPATAALQAVRRPLRPVRVRPAD
jgi:hypothetical protein